VGAYGGWNRGPQGAGHAKRLVAFADVDGILKRQARPPTQGLRDWGVGQPAPLSIQGWAMPRLPASALGAMRPKPARAVFALRVTIAEAKTSRPLRDVVRDGRGR
jgi:hypothetical protein